MVQKDFTDLQNHVKPPFQLLCHLAEYSYKCFIDNTEMHIKFPLKKLILQAQNTVEQLQYLPF